MTPRRKPAHRTSLVKKEFDVDLTLLQNRQLFLFEEINEESATRIVKALYALDTLSHKPIMLYINSGGGSCTAGMAIIDAMRTIESPVVTIITNEVCSMAGLIAIAGNKRVAYPNSVFMAHDLAYDITDYNGKASVRAKFYDEQYNRILNEHLKRYTKLTDEEIIYAQNHELWLTASQMIDKGVIDEIYKI